MNEKQEMIAKALEIAISLTGANDTWLWTDDNNDLKIGDPLYTTMKRVIQIMKADKLLETDETRKVFRGSSVR